MGHPLKVLLTSPYFGSAYGGGERYLGETATVVRDRFPDARVEIAGAVPADRERYRRMLGLDLNGIDLVATNRRVTPAHRLANRLTLLRPLRDRVIAGQAARATEGVDLHLAMTFLAPVSTRARRAVVVCQFPGESVAGLDGFQVVVCYSQYVRGWIRRRWGRDAVVVHPPVTLTAAEPDWAAKEPLILSVGRFFRGGHDKRHDAMLEAFLQACDEGLEGWRLHLAGTAHREGPHAGYVEELRRRAEGYPVEFHLDLGQDKLAELYDRASLYWHAAGLGATDAEPEKREHFGITPIEAMDRGAVPLLHRSGGLVELVNDGQDGLLWDGLPDLKRLTRELVADPARREAMGRAARAGARRFGREAFRERMAATLAPLVAELEAGR